MAKKHALIAAAAMALMSSLPTTASAAPAPGLQPAEEFQYRGVGAGAEGLSDKQMRDSAEVIAAHKQNCSC